jgi:putative ABC transport system permease protein
MLKSLFAVAFRNLKRYPGYGMLNIFGLTIGITFSLFLIFYIRDELSYDKHHTKAERIYRINSYIKEPDKEMLKWAVTQYPLGPTLQKKFPEVEQAVRMVSNDRILFKTGNVKLFEDKIFYTDSNFFKVFTADIIEGDPNTALTAPGNVVITQAVAVKYFGKVKGNINKVLTNDNGEVYSVKAVIGDAPKTSHIRYNVLISSSTLPKNFSNTWGNFSFYTYVLLKEGVTPQSFEKKLGGMYDEYMASIFAQYNIRIHYGIARVTDIHLRSDMQNEPEELGSMSYIYIFSAVVVFMLLIACINYMNLTTARSARRAKEIGIRKVTGSTKLQLVAQFLVESTLVTLLALVLSIVLILAFLPTFNSISGKQISYSSLFSAGTLLILVGMVLMVGLVGGSYPAFYLSQLQPVQVLKGSLSKSSSNVVLRRILVVTQFTIALIMLICTWVVDRQLDYLQSRDLGFNKEQVVSLRANTNKDIRSNILAFKNELLQNPAIKSVSTSQTTPGGNGVNFNLFSVETNKGFTDQGVDCYGVDEKYFETLSIPIVRGRNFNSLADTLRSIVVNEKMVEYFKWDEPLGKKVKFPGDTSGFYFEVIGVVKNFHQKSLYNPIAPLLMFYRPNAISILAKVSSDNIPNTISSIKKSWSTMMPDLEFSYTFLDDDFNAQYAADQRRGRIYAAFSMLTILITCLGLLGLIAFTTEQRQKEISIRKILGANLSQLVPLITKNFVLLVGVSCLVAFPVAYIFMNKWLQIFPYNTGITVWPFLYSGVTVLMITLATVMFHTIKAAIANPTRSLKVE